jgi:hypothetical protein
MAKAGFVLGDHQFLDPAENGPLSRFDEPKRQILGAPPPSFLDGIAREASKNSPAAKALLKGEFCGHGEPTMTVFDVVIDGEDVLDIAVRMDEEDEEDEEMEANLPLVAVRTPGGDWVAIFRREWEEAQATLEGTPRTTLTPAEAAQLDPDMRRGRVAIGFEYPCDATSRDDVGWLTIDVVLEGERKPVCLVDAEIA